MLAYILAIAVGLGSLAFYLAAFFFPEVHRRYDFIWGGVGLVYALVLWICARRITGGVLIGQTAAVSLIGWLGWQTLTLRRAKTPAGEQTTVSPDVAEKTKGSFLEPLTNLFRGSKSKPAPTPSEKAAPATPVAEEPVAPTIAETVENFEPAAMGVEESAPPEVTETVAEPEPAAAVVDEPIASEVMETVAEPEPVAPVVEEPAIPEATDTVVEDETIPAEPFATVEIPEAESTPDLEEDEPTASEIPLEEKGAADEEPEAAVEELTPEFDAEAMTEADVEELTPEFDAEAMTEADVEALTPEFDAEAMTDTSDVTPADEDRHQ